MSNVLTFDLGTSYFKVCLFDKSLNLVAHRRIAAPVEHPTLEQAELSVPALQRCLTTAVHELAEQTGGLGHVTQVCFASQANSFTLLDDSDRPLMPFILWADRRARKLTPQLRSIAAFTDFSRTTGLAHIDEHFMLAKLFWLQEHRPDILVRAHRLCGLGDYFVWWLTNNHLTEAGLAGLSGCVDIHKLEYWPKMTCRIHLPLAAWPSIVRAGTDAGPLRKEIANEWGLPDNCRMVMGCLDQYAGAIGSDNTTPGRVSETTGTVLATVRYADAFLLNAAPGVFQGPGFAPGTYFQMVFSNVSGAILEKYRNSLPDHLEFPDLDRLAAEVPPGAEGLRLHPQAPDLPVDQIFVGRMTAHHRGHEVRAIMEGVAAQLRRQVAALCGDDWPSEIRSAGGAARSQLWLQIKSQILGCPVIATRCAEPTSLGTARLARMSLQNSNQ